MQDTLNVVVGVVAAVVLFLHALDGFSAELQSTGGEALRRWLSKATANRLSGVLIGAFATAVVQSSSAVTALAVALVNAGTLSFRNTLGVLLGANVGTTATAWIVGFKLTAIGPWAIVLGALLPVLGQERLRLISKPLFYFGFIFFSLDLISGALTPLHQSPLWQQALQKADSPVMAVLLGMAMTALVQSSSVTIGVAILLVQQGLLPAPAAIAIALGANVGSTTTGLIASLRMDAAARLTAMANLVFNAVGVLAVLPFLPAFAGFALGMSTTPALAVAWAHLLFNAGTACGFTALLSLPPLDRWVMRRWPDPAPRSADPAAPAKPGRPPG